jgi:ribose transport system substrate-binding protein
MKRLFVLQIMLPIVLAMMTACRPAPTNNPTPNLTPTEEEKPRIALVMKTLTNPFFIEMERGAREAEEDFEIELIVRTASQETSIEQQIEIVESLIQDAVDAIVIAPGDSVRLIPILKQAQDAGIVVINIDNRLDEAFSEEQGLVGVPFISVDNEEAAYLSAKFISDQITTPTNVIILEGIRDALNAQQRHAGAIRAFEENPNITVVAEETANWKIEEGYEVTGELLTENPDVGAIFAANDMMALGAIQYLSETDRDDVLVAAFDALNEAKEAIEAGALAVTIDQQAAAQGYKGVEFAVMALQGEDLPDEFMIDVMVVTETTLEVPLE